MSRPERALTVWENERYSPVSGFGAQGLLIADRGAFSTEDGSTSWSTLEAASSALLSAGWRWEEDKTWTVDPTGTNADPLEGWTYGVNFGSISTSSSPVKGMSHFVRRRVHVRRQQFIAEDLCSTKDLTCDHCEIEELRRLSDQMLSALASASLIVYGDKPLTDIELNALKTKLVDALQLQISVPLGLTVSHFSLQKFAFPDRTTMSKMSSMMSTTNPLDNLGARGGELARGGYKEDERMELAKVVIRKHDSDFRAHCSKVNCGEACEFYTMTCPNEGCTYVMSKKWVAKHDAECGFKVVPCDRSCGEEVPRKDLDNHKSYACSLRPAQCPFVFLGCCAELKHLEVEKHLEDCTQAHLLLSLQVLQEQQSAVHALTKQVHALEVELSTHGMKLASAVTGTAAAVEGLRAMEKNLKGTQETTSRMDKALQRRVDDFRAEMVSTLTEVKGILKKTDGEVDSVKRVVASHHAVLNPPAPKP